VNLRRRRRDLPRTVVARAHPPLREKPLMRSRHVVAAVGALVLGAMSLLVLSSTRDAGAAAAVPSRVRIVHNVPDQCVGC
jgi:hypothetical protein